MTYDIWGLLLAMLVALTVGVRIGVWSEARLWREVAENGRRKESAGTLYNVTKDSP